MTETKAAVLQAIIEATNRHIKVLRSFGLDDTAKIFAIAKLDLQTKLHGISDEELEAFCQAVDLKRGLSAAEVIDFAARKKSSKA
jgi:hypothetical protein